MFCCFSFSFFFPTSRPHQIYAAGFAHDCAWKRRCLALTRRSEPRKQPRLDSRPPKLKQGVSPRILRTSTCAWSPVASHERRRPHGRGCGLVPPTIQPSPPTCACHDCNSMRRPHVAKGARMQPVLEASAHVRQLPCVVLDESRLNTGMPPVVPGRWVPKTPAVQPQHVWSASNCQRFLPLIISVRGECDPSPCRWLLDFVAACSYGMDMFGANLLLLRGRAGWGQGWLGEPNQSPP